ncbi:hypothetical protein AB0A60_17180 [Streptomyces sp. NPDC046275]|uniref:hypothetical protein n=1 Tax=Streptomyces sp. NPDC046275 TaxID=3157201 RepID=UPI0033C1EC94
MNAFELVDLSLHTEELGRFRVPLREGTASAPVTLPEGTVINVGLTFRLGREIDGLTLEETRVRDGTVVSTARTVLGGFRTGGPYEVRLPAERLPVGRAHCGEYEVTSRFTDGTGRELVTLRHRLRLVHQPAPDPGRDPAPAS